ncbi:MAG TPA: EVE domain-containing protein [Saprospiraceae bacterium]|nr:EVE domain-containing protein [Saprospiraceae bacterium]HMQ81353.1 EVE domain-containing protein [Saprospiraceae bacterium]
MNYWLVKSEPFVFSFDQLEKDGHAMWDGVRNYAARNHMRSMQPGDLVLYYHSREGLEVVGIAKVSKAAYPDPTAEQGDWSVVDLAPFKRLVQPVSLKTIKATPELASMLLIKIGRLSVMPVSEQEFFKILELGQTNL